LLLSWEKSTKNRVPVFTFIREIITRLGRRQEDRPFAPQHCIDALIRARLDRKVRRTTNPPNVNLLTLAGLAEFVLQFSTFLMVAMTADVHICWFSLKWREGALH
jgi:hypothetical protein